MKKFFFPALLLLGIAFGAFVPSHPQAPPPTTHYTVQEVLPFDTLLTVPCLGEDVHLYGTIHVTHHLAITGNHYIEHVVHVPRDVVGVGMTSGAQWMGKGQTQYTNVGTLSGGQNTVSYNNAFIIIGKGAVSNLLMHDNLSSTVYADGTVETRVEHSWVECR